MDWFLYDKGLRHERVNQSISYSVTSFKSSNINEVIRSVLNFFIFFYDKISQVQKSTKRIQGTKKYQNALKSIKTQSI